MLDECDVEMPKIEKGQRLGPWILDKLVVRHQQTCEIWSAVHFSNKSRVALKVKDFEEMTEEFRFIIMCCHETATLPIMDINTKYKGDIFGTYKHLGWIAMKQYDTDLYHLEQTTVLKFWKTILEQCVSQVYVMNKMHALHTDLKSMNILITANEDTNFCEVAICDFGLADNVDLLIRKGRPSEDHDYYMMCGGMYPGQPMGVRVDYEAIGIAIGFAMLGMSYQRHFQVHDKSVADQRKWEVLKNVIPTPLHKYFEFVAEMKWTDTGMPSELYHRITNWLKTN
jgi:hypothetical protein